MKEFALLFRQPGFEQGKPDPEAFKALHKKWQDWSGRIVSEGKLSSNGLRLAMEGRVLKPGGVITDGPYVEIREILGSFIVIKAENLEEATTLAHGCPILESGGSVEIRPVFGS